MRELLNYLGICLPHKWGKWRPYGDEERRVCKNCNEEDFRKAR